MRHFIKLIPLTVFLCACNDPNTEVRLELKKINEGIAVQQHQEAPPRVSHQEVYQAGNYRSPFEVPNEVLQAQARAEAQTKLITNTTALIPTTNAQTTVVPKKTYYPNAITVDTKRPRDYLENFSLEGLKMTGVVGDGKDWRALIQTPDGNIVMIKTGDYIGENFGQVMQIHKSGITVRQAVKVEDNIYIPKTIVIPVTTSTTKSNTTAATGDDQNSASNSKSAQSSVTNKTSHTSPL